MAGTAVTITAITVRAPSIATTPPVPTGAHKPVTARRSSAATPKYADIISNHASVLNGSAFVKHIGIATLYGGNHVSTNTGTGTPARGTISGIGNAIDPATCCIERHGATDFRRQAVRPVTLR